MCYIRYIFIAFFLILPSFCLAKSVDYSSRLSECEIYKGQVIAILDQYGLSSDYYYLMVAESYCHLNTSPKGAQGFWQMMPFIQKHYGCNDHTSLVCQTHAASKYILHLENMFNKDFRKVIYAYNQGGHNLIKNGPTSQAISHYNTIMSLIKADRESTNED